MYKLIACLSLFIRNFVLPNPFEQLPIPLYITISGIEITIPVVILNWIAESFLYPITFMVVGVYYQKGIDNPAKGSALYLLFYCIHVGMLFIMSCFQFSRIIIIITIISYITLHIGFNVIKNKLSYIL